MLAQRGRGTSDSVTNSVLRGHVFMSFASQRTVICMEMLARR
jgi:hypothetical protein